ncbi:MAG: hypothetical protein SCK28_07265 [Bacillota bacterium]|nr:hypothetical protein [Bacillota bacterium]
MDNFRCDCSKLLFQMTETKVIIKCRHCKRYIIVHTKGVEDVEFANNVYPEMFDKKEKTFMAQL